MTKSRLPNRSPQPDDIVLWPDDSWATLRDVRNGHYDWKSDDYEIIDHTHTARLKALDVYDEDM
ncbi:hypothetical protein ACTJJ7_11820 [Phyllobacterium sp. 22229]|uniref:Uncharacterized protein n=1 Tax=Agrobacterium radiobacter TaxID=362 RepID=A0ABD5LL12_AGRRD